MDIKFNSKRVLNLLKTSVNLINKKVYHSRALQVYLLAHVPLVPITLWQLLRFAKHRKKQSQVLPSVL